MTVIIWLCLGKNSLFRLNSAIVSSSTQSGAVSFHSSLQTALTQHMFTSHQATFTTMHHTVLFSRALCLLVTHSVNPNLNRLVPRRATQQTSKSFAHLKGFLFIICHVRWQRLRCVTVGQIFVPAGKSVRQKGNIPRKRHQISCFCVLCVSQSLQL